MKILLTFALGTGVCAVANLREFEGSALAKCSFITRKSAAAGVDRHVDRRGSKEGSRRLREAWRRAESMPHTFAFLQDCAGALKPEYHVGTVLAARAVQRRMSRRTMSSLRRAVRGWFRSRRNAAQDGAGKFFSCRPRGRDGRGKERRLAPWADAVEMESFRFFRSIEVRNYPAIAIRAVSGPFDQDMPVDIARRLTENGKSASRVSQASDSPSDAIAGADAVGAESKRQRNVCAIF